MLSTDDNQTMITETTPYDIAVAWFAGWFEGEGSIVLTDPSPRGGIYLRLSGGSTDLDTIECIHRVFGGNFYGPFLTKTPRGEAGKPIWNWSLTRNDEIRKLANEIRPYLSKRRQEQVDHALATARPADPLPSEDERFRALIDWDGDCWLWRGHLDKFGFGTWQRVQGSRVQVHRWYYEKICGSVPPRLVNKCGQKSCVNPAHWKSAKKVYVLAEDET